MVRKLYRYLTRPHILPSKWTSKKKQKKPLQKQENVVLPQKAPRCKKETATVWPVKPS